MRPCMAYFPFFFCCKNCQKEKCVDWEMQGSTQNGTRIILFTSWGIQPELKLLVFSNKCSPTRSLKNTIFQVVLLFCPPWWCFVDFIKFPTLFFFFFFFLFNLAAGIQWPRQHFRGLDNKYNGHIRGVQWNHEDLFGWNAVSFSLYFDTCF